MFLQLLFLFLGLIFLNPFNLPLFYYVLFTELVQDGYGIECMHLVKVVVLDLSPPLLDRGSPVIAVNLLMDLIRYKNKQKQNINIK